jgi:hypothetical protein
MAYKGSAWSAVFFPLHPPLCFSYSPPLCTLLRATCIFYSTNKSGSLGTWILESTSAWKTLPPLLPTTWQILSYPLRSCVNHLSHKEIFQQIVDLHFPVTTILLCFIYLFIIFITIWICAIYSFTCSLLLHYHLEFKVCNATCLLWQPKLLRHYQTCREISKTFVESDRVIMSPFCEWAAKWQPHPLTEIPML